MNLRAYDALVSTFTRLYRYQHLGSIVGWDQAAMMPPKGNAARGAALAELEVLMHQTLTDPSLPDLMARAVDEALDAAQAANLREMRRDWSKPRAWRVRAVSTPGAHSERKMTGPVFC